MILSRDYFDRPTLEVARSLVGKYLVREQGSGLIAGRIIEVEAYIGTEDKACHASKGRTRRTDVLFGPPGHAYVYLCYGMYEMLNVVTEQEGFPAAILLRAVECEGKLIDGPGRLTRAFDVDRRLNRCDLTLGQSLWFEDRGEAPPDNLLATHPRIGVDYAGEWAHKPWRFRLTTEVSKPRRPNPKRSLTNK
ncbi:MAG: 3-methyladenine DNA glycosylase [Nitrospira sp. SCN 59-13]|nr:MAG: 3-methyladenine DNA glycosylase [Nitrospira sp. SCN 59-13]